MSQLAFLPALSHPELVAPPVAAALATLGASRLLIDSRVVELPRIIIGAGISGAKLFLPGAVLASLPTAEVIEGLASTSS